MRQIGTTILLICIAQSASASDELPDHGQLRLRVFFKNGNGLPGPGWVTADQQGHYYVGGNFKGRHRFGTNVFTSSRAFEAFIAKYDRFTNCIWARHIPNAVTYDGAAFAAGALFITGTLTGSVMLHDLALPSNGPNDAFIAKLDANGTFLWAKRFAKRLRGRDAAGGWGVATDESGNAYFTGEFMGEATFDHTTLKTRTESGHREVFIGKCDTHGNLIWLVQDGNDRTSVRGIAVDQQQNIYLTGTYNGRVSFHAGEVSNDAEDVFLAKYSSDGRPLWIRTPGGPQGRTGHNVAVDGYGSPHIAGLFQGTDVFGPTNIVIVDKAYPNQFVAKYNAAGDFQWVRQFRRGDFDFSNVISLEAEGVTLPPRITSRRSAETNAEVHNLIVATKLVRGLPDSESAVAGPIQRPVLGVQKVGELIFLFWSNDFPGFELEGTEALTPFPIWETVSGTPQTIQDHYVMAIPITAAQKFYRLRARNLPLPANADTDE